MPHSVEELIATHESELRRAMLASDVAALDRLVDDTLVFTMPGGAVVDKASDLDAHRSGRIRLTKLEASDERIAIHGSVAVVNVLIELAGAFDGVAFGGPFRYTRVWVERPEGWRVVAGHVCAVVA